MQSQLRNNDTFLQEIINRARRDWNLLRSQEQIEADQWLQAHRFLDPLMLIEDLDFDLK